MLARDTVCKALVNNDVDFRRWIDSERIRWRANVADAVESLGGFAQPRCVNYWANHR